MDLSGDRILVAGVTGVLGGAITAGPVGSVGLVGLVGLIGPVGSAGSGVLVAFAGRDPGRSAQPAGAYPGARVARADACASQPTPLARAVREASAAAGRRLTVVVASGAGAVDAADEVGGQAAEPLTAIDHPAPAACSHGARGIVRPGFTVGAFSRTAAAVADAMSAGAEPFCPDPDGTRVVGRRAR